MAGGPRSAGEIESGPTGSGGEGLRKRHEQGNSQLLGGTSGGRALSFAQKSSRDSHFGVTQRPPLKPSRPGFPGPGSVLNWALQGSIIPGQAPAASCTPQISLPAGPGLFLDTPKLPAPNPGLFLWGSSSSWTPQKSLLLGPASSRGDQPLLHISNFPPSGFSPFPEGHPLPEHPKTPSCPAPVSSQGS